MSKPYALVASFEEVPAFFAAVGKVREAGFRRWDTYVPFPVHGLGAQMGQSRSKVPCFTLAGGILGFLSGTLITWFTNGFNYPIIVGGKPLWSPVFPFPVMYELTILLAALATLIGMFATNGLPRHHHPIFDYKDFVRSSDDRLFIVIECADANFKAEATPVFLEGLGADKVEFVQR